MAYHKQHCAPAVKYQAFTTDFNAAYGEVAGILKKVASYALEKFNLGDLVFGVYHLAEVGHKTPYGSQCQHHDMQQQQQEQLLQLL